MKNPIKEVLQYFSRDNKFECHNPIQHGFDSQVKVISDDEQIVDLDKYRMTPKRINATRMIYDMNSFKKYIDIFSAGAGDRSKENQHFGTSMVFVEVKLDSQQPISVNCVLDHHSDFSKPSNCDHTVELDCSNDRAFNDWLRHDNEWIPQSKLVEFFKKNNSFFNDSQDLLKLLQLIEEVKSETKRKDTSRTNEIGTSVNTSFSQLGSFDFKFKPITSINKAYIVDVDVYADYTDRGLQLKFSIRNPKAIWNQIAVDIRSMLEELNEKVVVF